MQGSVSIPMSWFAGWVFGGSLAISIEGMFPDSSFKKGSTNSYQLRVIQKLYAIIYVRGGL